MYIVFFKCDKFDALRYEYFNTWYQSGDSLQNVHNVIRNKKSCTDKENVHIYFTNC